MDSDELHPQRYVWITAALSLCAGGYTFLTKDEIESIRAEFDQNRSERIPQRKLAFEVTKITHGEEHARRQERIANTLFGRGNLSELDSSEIATISEEIPAVKTTADSSIIDVLVKTGLASSNSDARRLLDGNAVYINGEQVSRENFEPPDFQNGRLLLRRGKAYKDSALIELE